MSSPITAISLLGLLTTPAHTRVALLRQAAGALHPCPQESSPITTISLSADARHLLVALQCSTINCWALGAATAPYPQALDVGKWAQRTGCSGAHHAPFAARVQLPVLCCVGLEREAWGYTGNQPLNPRHAVLE